jgi:hypothetical protein
MDTGNRAGAATAMSHRSIRRSSKGRSVMSATLIANTGTPGARGPFRLAPLTSMLERAILHRRSFPPQPNVLD